MKIVRTLSVLVPLLCGVAQVLARDLVVPTAEFATIQRALDFAAGGDTVIVRPGEYLLVEPLVFNRLHDPDDPRSPPLKNITLRSEAGPGSTFLVADEAAANGTDETMPLVVLEKGEGRETIVEGLALIARRGPGNEAIRVRASSPTILGCVFDDEGEADPGTGPALRVIDGSPLVEACVFRAYRHRGVLVEGGSAEVVRCSFEDNHSSLGGALLARDDANVTVSDCAFTSNSAEYGGALAASRSRVRLERSVFQRNRATDQGGAIFVDDAAIELVECEVARNVAGPRGGTGGGLCVVSQGRANLAATSVVDNRAELGAGLCVSGSLTITDSVVRGNHAGSEGGGLFLVFAEADGQRVTFLDNTAEIGGAISVAGGNALFERVTVTRNQGIEHTGALQVSTGANVVLESSIVWGNGPRAILADETSRIAATFSNVETDAGVLAGAGNICADPLFCAFGAAEVTLSPGDSLAGELDFRAALASVSPCTGAGKGGVHMGALEPGCDEGGAVTLHVRLAAGEHSVGSVTVPHGVTLAASVRGEAKVDGHLKLEGASRLEGIHVRGGVETSTGSRPVIEGCTVNGTPGFALEIEYRSFPLVVDSTFADSGAAISCAAGSRSRFVDCTIRDSRGVGLALSDAEAELVDCLLTRNGGSACFVDGTSARLLLESCVVESNRSTEAGFGAGGITARGGCEVVLARCRIAGNAARTTAALSLAGACATLTNCVVSGNFSQFGNTIRAISIEEFPFSSLTLNHCTLAGNGTGNLRDAVISATETDLSVRNSIIWGNEAQLAATAGIRGTVEFSCVDGEIVGAIAHSMTREDPRFVRPGTFDFSEGTAAVTRGEGVLPDFIVDPGDYRLAVGSPARDAGSSEGSLPFDHDLHARPCGPGVDMGAFEAGDCELLEFRRGDVDGDGRRSITDALAVAQVVTGDRPAGCLDATDANDDGEANLTDALFLLNHLFLSGPEPPPPSAACGVDPTSDGLDCEAHAGC